MDVTPESTRGEGPALGDDGAAFAEAEGLRPLAGEREVDSPSPLDEFDSATLLEALEPDEAESDGDFAEGGEGEEEDNADIDGGPDVEGDLVGGESPEARDRRHEEGGADEVQAFAEHDFPDEAGEGGEATVIQERIRSLREQRRQAIDDFDRPTEARLTEEIEDLQLDLLRAEQAGQVREAQARNYQDSYLSAVDAMEARYPEALDEQSAFHRILDNKIAAAQARRDPALGNPKFILEFADEVAAMLGGHGAAGRRSLSQARSRPVGSVLAPGHQTAARPGREQLSRMIHEMPLEELERLVCTE